MTFGIPRLSCAPCSAQNPCFSHAAGKELFIVSDLSEVWVWANLKDADLAAVSAAGRTAAALIEGPAGVVAHGRIDIVSGTVSEQTRTARARIVVPNPRGALRPGMFVTGDGKIYVTDVLDAVRISNGERGPAAV